MPALGNHLDFAKYEARNMVVQNGNPNPVAGQVKGQLWMNNLDNTLYYWDGSAWVAAKSGAPTGAAGGDLAGSYPNPTIGLLKVTDAHVAAANKDGAAGTYSMRRLGSTAGTAAAGDDARLTDSRAPNGTAGGDLTGSYPTPQIAAGAIVNADVNAAAAITYGKLNLALSIVNGDIAAGAAITYAKLALTNSLVNGDIAAAAAIAWSKINTAGQIVNADVNAAAAITYGKLALANSIVNGDIAPAAAIAYSKLNLAGTIVNADVGAAAAIAYSKLNLTGQILNADLAGSIALSKLATDPLARANHTGTQLAATISNFDAQVQTQRLDQHAAPTAPVALNGQKITGLADGTAGTDAVTKQQLDAVATGLDVKGSVRAASTANVTLATPGTTIDVVTLVAGDRVLLKNQTTASENGIWVWNGAAVPMTRATDADTSAEVNSGLFTFVEEGTANSDSGWVLSTNNPITLGTTGLTFAQFSGAGQIIDGAGLLKTGNTLDVNVDNSSIEINADILRIKALGVTGAMLAALSVDLTTKVTGTLPLTNGGTGQTTAKAARETGLAAAGYYSSATHGAGTTITITQATHLLRATRGLIVQVQDEATGNVVLPDISVSAAGDVTVTFGASVTANAYRVTVTG
jgi:hypothetical protein